MRHVVGRIFARFPTEELDPYASMTDTHLTAGARHAGLAS
jgi:hypothetical protein